ncbi:Cullin-5 [Cichlidogyrus casuarinus]|uniref:Cullin-5 n=1 Tax=Cichlidogyrus casuarinus TaxID=1844966 RepID=A0ABD2QKB6_9PLAT
MFGDIHHIVSWESSKCDDIMHSLTKVITTSIIQAKQRVMANQGESALLRAYINEWTRFYLLTDYLPKPFHPVETHLLTKHTNRHNKTRDFPSSIIRNLMLELWQENIFDEIKEQLKDCAIKLIQDERNGQVIESRFVIGFRESCVTLSLLFDKNANLYADNFEKAYIENTESFYRIRCVEYIAEQGIRKYMEYAQGKLAEEQQRATKYLETKHEFDSVSKLMHACVQTFVMEDINLIMEEFPILLSEENVPMLHLAYDLIQRVPKGVERVLELLERYICDTGISDMRSVADTISKDAEKYVARLLCLYKRFSNIVTQAFNQDSHFFTARDKAFQDIVNDASVFTLDIPISLKANARRPESRCPELLASYCDMLLRKSPTNRRLKTEEVEDRINDVVLILKYVQSKDVFMRVHKSHLMRRLLLETSADNDLEVEMIDRLQSVGMPGEQVNRLRRMFQDIKVSLDLTGSFRETLRNNNSSPGPTGDLISLKILTSAAWVPPPAQQKSSLALPLELEDFIPQIEQFYRDRHNGRKLIWQYHLSHGIIAFQTEVGKFELEVTTFQMVVLWAWNQFPKQKFRIDALLTATGLSDNDLRRTLWSLCEHAKLERQVLNYAPKVSSEKELNHETEFWLNLQFANVKQNKIQHKRRVNVIGRLQLTHEQCPEDESQAIIQLRQLRVQEAVNKIMKTRKRMHHNELYKQLIELLQSQFVPSKRLVKEVIEWLLDHKYLRRDETDFSTYIYI